MRQANIYPGVYDITTGELPGEIFLDLDGKIMKLPLRGWICPVVQMAAPSVAIYSAGDKCLEAVTCDTDGREHHRVGSNKIRAVYRLGTRASG